MLDYLDTVDVGSISSWCKRRLSSAKCSTPRNNVLLSTSDSNSAGRCGQLEEDDAMDNEAT